LKTYKITEDAKLDLIEIAEYTLKKWGRNIFNQYKNGLTTKFESIANQTIGHKTFSVKLSDVYVTKFRYHFIFYMQVQKEIIVIAVIHEKRDILRCLINRLED